MKNKLLNSKEAAKYLGYKESTLAVWRSKNHRNDLPYIKVGRLVRYKFSDIKKWKDRKQGNRKQDASPISFEDLCKIGIELLTSIISLDDGGRGFVNSVFHERFKIELTEEEMAITLRIIHDVVELYYKRVFSDKIIQAPAII